MNPNKVLNLGNKYSKKELSQLLGEKTLATVREGVYSCKNSKSYFLFVDLEKNEKKPRFHFNDFFEEDFFHWDSQTPQHIDTVKIKSVINEELTTYLFVRISQKIKSITQPFVFCGRLRYLEHDKNTTKPVHIIFHSIDFEEFTENEELKSIYRWKPSFIGKSSNSNISKKGQISNQRLNNFKKPNKTERKGLITSRVGQGYYRQQIIEKWGGRCPITGINIQSILIASHIVPWSESSDHERLDVENGILLSPSYDALFDKHLISFENDGNIIISTKMSLDNKNKIGLSPEIKIQVTDGMSPYLERHRKKLRYKEHLK